MKPNAQCVGNNLLDTSRIVSKVNQVGTSCPTRTGWQKDVLEFHLELQPRFMLIRVRVGCDNILGDEI